LYDVLINGTPCEEKAGVGEYRVKSLERCAAFEDFPAHLDRAKLKKREKSWIDESKRNHALHWKRKDRLVEGMQYLRRECRKRWALPAE
jgi:hypothetical protein